MLKLCIFGENPKPRILCLGAHCDDIEIGCGGTILRILKKVPNAQFKWIVFSGNDDRKKEAYSSANAFLKEVRVKDIAVESFRESYFPFIGDQIKDYFEMFVKDFAPDIIFTHYRDDEHQDHRLISSLTWNTFRDNLILEYEIPKFDGDLGNPNFYVPLSDNFVESKVGHIMKFFKSQTSRQWFDEETFKSILRIRGVEASSPRYAEAFYCRKIVII